MKPQWIFAIGLAAKSPGFGDGEGIQSPQVNTKPAFHRHARWKRGEATGTSFATEIDHQLS
jgi:hypothetical protein